MAENEVSGQNMKDDMTKELNNHPQRVFANGESDERSVIRKFRITVNGSIPVEGGVKE